MSRMTVVALGLIMACFLAAVPPCAEAQTGAAIATVTGSVADNSGAVIPGAAVQLIDLSTNQSREQETNADGQYVFSDVSPGMYKIVVTKQGFGQATVLSLKVEVGKSYTVNLSLEVGAVTESVKVTAGTGAELQTQDATLGNVIRSDYLLRLPVIDRQANRLYSLQPSVSPQGYGFVGSGAQAGARGDQSTWLVDGIDDTQGAFPTTGNNTTFPLVAESIEEFGAGVTNINATIGRAGGAQLFVVRKRGGNTLHGSVYLYEQNDNLNANTWTRNRTQEKNPELKDHRFGFSVGGPIIKDKTFFFFNYEGRRFPNSTDIKRLVPTDTMRAGILRFRDGAGNVVSYPLATSTLCGPTNTSPCDPRGLGLNPVVSALFQLMPLPNDSSVGDGLNVQGFRVPVSTGEKSEYFWLRLDHNISKSWRFEGSFGWYRNIADAGTGPFGGQADISGLLPGHVLGQAVPLRHDQQFPRNIVGALTTQLTPRAINDFRFGFTRMYFWRKGTPPFPQVPDTNVALNFASGLLDNPGDLTPNLNSLIQGDWQRLYQLGDTLSWVKGGHTLQFGGTERIIRHLHTRTDRLSGSPEPVGSLNAGTFFRVPADNEPPLCVGAGINCLASGDVGRWDSLYAASLGIIDNVSVLYTRDANFNPNPIGTPLEGRFRYSAGNFFAADVWRIRPTLTLNYGLNYEFQLPTEEENGRIAINIDTATGKIITPKEYIEAKRQAALQGAIFNPQIGYMPIRKLGRKRLTDTDWTNLGPRVGAAWNPSFKGGVLGRLLGDRKTVFRGGYSLTFDRLDLVQLAIFPMLSPGFGQLATEKAPVNAQGQPFRIDVDGPAPIPPLPVASPPLILGVPFQESLSFQVDPTMGVGRHHALDLTIQRELRGDLLLEFGYVGHLGRNLPQTFNLNSVPFFMKDSLSEQTFAKAYDALAGQLRAGVTAGSVTTQPWFENMLPPIATLQALGGCGTTFTTATQCLASGFGADIVAGNVSTFWLTGIDEFRLKAGLPPVNNLQVLDFFNRTDGGISNYHAFILTLRKRPSHGFSFDFNYTFSRSLDQVGAIQNSPQEFSTSFFPNADYGPSFFDHKHVANLTWYYELPLGRGRRWTTGSWVDKLIGGWYTGGIFTAFTGQPLEMLQSNQAFGGGVALPFGPGAIPLVSTEKFSTAVHSGVAGSGGVGINGDPATGGSGLNLFADPALVFNSFRPILLSQDTRGGRGVLRGLGHWNFDFSIGKSTTMTEKVRLLLAFDFFNLFNHPEFADPSPAAFFSTPYWLDAKNAAAFGVLDSQFNQPRRVQVGLRVEF